MIDEDSFVVLVYAGITIAPCLVIGLLMLGGLVGGAWVLQRLADRVSK